MQSDVCVYVYTSTCVCVGKSVRKWMFVYTRYVCICICAVERKKSNIHADLSLIPRHSPLRAWERGYTDLVRN